MQHSRRKAANQIVAADCWMTTDVNAWNSGCHSQEDWN
jgi:hypothetical protein